MPFSRRAMRFLRAYGEGVALMRVSILYTGKCELGMGGVTIYRIGLSEIYMIGMQDIVVPPPGLVIFLIAFEELLYLID